MSYPAVFITVAALEILSVILIFVFKDVLHSILALSSFFLLNSILFFMLEQPIIALLQLFIMVGGVTTYLFVGVASASYSHFKHTNYIALIFLSAATTFLFLYKVSDTRFLNTQQNFLSDQAISAALTSNIGLLYIIAFMLFSIGLGSIILLKNLGAKK